MKQPAVSKSRFTLTLFASIAIAAILLTNLTRCEAMASKQASKNIQIENQYLKFVITPDGKNLSFIDKKTGTDYCVQKPASPVAFITKAGKDYNASSASFADGKLTIKFDRASSVGVIEVVSQKNYVTLKVLSLSDSNGVEKFTFIDVPLTTKGTLEDTFTTCALALNLQTNILELPGPNSRLRAMCYPRFGFTGAETAIIGCPNAELRNIMKEVVTAAPDLPHSPMGGPWALDADRTRTRGSYVFNFANLTEKTVDRWIDYTKKMGVNQIDFHGGQSFRFGDFEPNATMYPNGRKDLKAVIDKLHQGGIQAGLHTYAFFINKYSPLVTPVPDPRLAKDATFTLAADISADANTVEVAESTKDMIAPNTGFFVRNSVTIQIDNELITYKNISKEAPYRFIDCKRGELGTKITAHSKGAKVHHLKECFGLFLPDGDSTLFAEVAQKTADMFNECGFDFIYLDAIDAEDAVAGPENGWHYGSKFVFELCKRLKRPAIIEMSAFHHHFWFARSRMGAWDAPKRGHKEFTNIHLAQNEKYKRIFLPANIGWWALELWNGPGYEPTFPDDLEYLLCKALGTDSGLSFIRGEPDLLDKDPYMQKLAKLTKQYETLRYANYFPQSIKDKVKVAGDEFTLEQGQKPDQWQLRPIQYAKHKVEALDGVTNIWQTQNKFGKQPVKLRIEPLMSAVSYDAPESIVIADFNKPADFKDRQAAKGITADLKTSTDQVKVGAASGSFTASNTNNTKTASWAQIGRTFAPTLNLEKQQGLGVWIYGDGKGEVLNFQVRSPEHIIPAYGEHYVIIDFTGWRYFELLEFEGERFENYSWPYGNIVYDVYRQSYQIYSFNIVYSSIESLGLWYNNIPANGTVTCFLSPIKALPLSHKKLINPSITVGDKTVTFNTEIESGYYLEFKSAEDCKLYGPKGEFVRDVTVQGDIPVLNAGQNQVKFDSKSDSNRRVRANITVITWSDTPLKP